MISQHYLRTEDEAPRSGQACQSEANSAEKLQRLNGPLTALFLYIDELEKLSLSGSRTGKERDYQVRLVTNARAQAERALAIIAPAMTEHMPLVLPRRKDCVKSSVVLGTRGDGPALTKREHEALNLIIEGCSNKEGAVRMNIGRRTFESHRAEVMRKLNARNAADLVRKQMKTE